MSRHDADQIDPAGQADMGPERRALSVGARFGVGTEYAQGVAAERNRIKAALDAIQREAAPLMIEGSAVTRAMAKVLGEMRRAVEGGA